jgi:outer membrane protein OmpA-like peptidoglycan-associated protein
MKFALPLLIFSLLRVSLLAQEATLVVYFGLNESSISYSEDEKLQVWLGEFEDTLKRIELIGYTDFLASDEYNLRLYQKRAESVMAKIEANPRVNYRMSLVSAKGEEFSTSNGSSDGIQSDRRVEIKILRK